MGTGNSDTMQASNSTRMADTSMTLRLACLFSEAYGQESIVAPSNGVISNALHSTPLKVDSGVCSIYGNQLYMGASLQCVCKSAGDSAWSQDTRGCLAADYKEGVPEVIAHGTCYAGSTCRTGTFPAQTLYNAYMSCKTW